MPFMHATKFRCERRRRGATGGFTLVELLVVIGIIAVLMGLLLPVLSSGRRAAQSAACRAQLRQIGQAMLAYTQAHRDRLHRAKDGSLWLAVARPPGNPTGPLLPRLISTESTSAYWAVPYLPYLAPRGLVDASGDAAEQIRVFAGKIWRCPSAGRADPLNTTDPDNPASYGINARVTQGKSEAVKNAAGAVIGVRTLAANLKFYPRPSEVIIVHDAVEAKFEDNEKDTLSAFDTPTNLSYWRPGGATYDTYPNAVNEYYRHNRQCNVLWLDGHVDAIRESNGQNVPRNWYEGR